MSQKEQMPAAITAGQLLGVVSMVMVSFLLIFIKQKILGLAFFAPMLLLAQLLALTGALLSAYSIKDLRDLKNYAIAGVILNLFPLLLSMAYLTIVAVAYLQSF
jgi:hypothetical protein